MEQSENRMEKSVIVRAGGNVIIKDYDKIIMLLVALVIVISALNVIGYCVIAIYVSIPDSMPLPEYWFNAP